MLELGYDGVIERREYTLELGLPRPLCILYLSDLHLNGFSGKLIDRLLALLRDCSPDLILLGGDYLDTRAGMPHFERLLEYVKRHDHVLAISGNHDRFFGLNTIKNLLTAHGIHWLDDRPALLSIDGVRVAVDTEGTRCAEPAHVRILSLHRPDHPPQPNPYHLIFAGHLHGSQFVFWKNGHALFPGRLFYRWNILQKQWGHCLYLISKGLGDTLPVRYNCRRDVLMVRVM